MWTTCGANTDPELSSAQLSFLGRLSWHGLRWGAAGVKSPVVTFSDFVELFACRAPVNFPV